MALAVVAQTACRPVAKDPVVLSLGEDVVRRSDFDRHVAQLEAQGGDPLSLEVRRALLEPWLEEQVQVLEARQRGLVKPGAGADDERRGVLALLAEYSRVKVSDAEVAAYYQARPDEFHVPESLTLRQILVATLNEARDVRRRLAKDPNSFEAIAREVSKGPEAAAGGLMGTFARGQLPTELETAAFALRERALSEIVETSLGFHVLRVDERRPEREETLPQATLRIRTLLERQKADRNVREFVSGLMARAKVNHAAALAPSRPS